MSDTVMRNSTNTRVMCEASCVRCRQSVLDRCQRRRPGAGQGLRFQIVLRVFPDVGREPPAGFAPPPVTDTAFFTRRGLVAAPRPARPLVPFSNSICSLCISVSHFGNSHNIKNFIIIIIISIVMICDQRSLPSNCFWGPQAASV